MCKHEGVEYDHPVWYHIETQVSEQYWVEFEAAFVKIDGRYEKYGCLDCGERERLFVEKRVDVVWKDHLSEGEYADFEEAHDLVYKTEWHEDYDW